MKGRDGRVRRKRGRERKKRQPDRGTEREKRQTDRGREIAREIYKGR